MRRRRSREAVVFGVAFLDVLATTIGGLAFLLVIAVLAVGSDIVFPPPEITTETLIDAYEGTPYEVWLAAREGLGRYEWRIEGGEPPTGLVLEPRSGRLFGVPEAGGGGPQVFEFEVSTTATGPDGGAKIDRREYTIAVHRDVRVSVPPVRVATEPELPMAFVGEAYPLTLAAEGGQPPYQWSGSSVAGLSLAPDGTISGVPDVVGSHTLGVTVTTRSGARASRELRLRVSELHPPPPPVPPLEILIEEIAPAVAEQPYALAPSAQGGTPPYRWEISGAVGEWLTADAAAVRFGGTPGVADVARADVRLRVSDAAGRSSTSGPIPFEVLPPAGVDPPPLSLETRALVDARVAEPYDLAIAVRGGFPPYSWSAEGVADGIRVDSTTGRLSGTPAAPSAGNVSIAVRDASGTTVRATLPLRVRPRLTPVRILTADLPEARAGAPWRLALSAVGGFPPYHWQLTEGALPPGLAFDTLTGVLEGVPTEPGTWRALVGAEDGERSAAEAPAELEFTVLTASGALPLEIRTEALPTLLKGGSVDLALASRGGRPPIIWTLDPVPEGLDLDVDRLVGEPAVAGVSTVTLRASDQDGQSMAIDLELRVRNVAPFLLALMATVLALVLFALVLYLRRRSARLAPRALQILSRSVPNARASSEYEVQLACSGGVEPFRWRIVDGGLPNGLELDPTGRIHGRPFEGLSLDEPRDFAFTVEVRDDLGQTARQTL